MGQAKGKGFDLPKAGINVLRMGRLPYLDNLRAVALLLGIVFHAAIVYAADIGYALQTEERSTVLGFFCYFIHSFRMPLFFAISGFFTGLVQDQKGRDFFWRGRLQRVLLPAGFGLFALAPIQYYLMHLSKKGDVDFFYFYWKYWLGDEFGTSHIWFLIYLFLYSLLWKILSLPFFHRLSSQFFGRSFLNKASSQISLIFKKPIHIAIGGFLLTFCFTWLANRFWRKGDTVFSIDLVLFLYQGSFYLWGIVLYYKKELFVPKPQNSSSLVLLFLISLSLFVGFHRMEIEDPLWKPWVWVDPWTRTIHLFLWSLVPWIWIQTFVRAFQKWGNQSNAFWKYTIASSLAIYLFHHPISLGVAYWILQTRPAFSLGLQFGFHTLIVFAGSFLLYEALVRKFSLFRWLTGTKV